MFTSAFISSDLKCDTSLISPSGGADLDHRDADSLRSVNPLADGSAEGGAVAGSPETAQGDKQKDQNRKRRRVGKSMLRGRDFTLKRAAFMIEELHAAYDGLAKRLTKHGVELKAVAATAQAPSSGADQPLRAHPPAAPVLSPVLAHTVTPRSRIAAANFQDSNRNAPVPWPVKAFADAAEARCIFSASVVSDTHAVPHLMPTGHLLSYSQTVNRVRYVLLDCNEAWTQHLGRSRPQVVGANLENVFGATTWQQLQEGLRMVWHLQHGVILVQNVLLQWNMFSGGLMVDMLIWLEDQPRSSMIARPVTVAASAMTAPSVPLGSAPSLQIMHVTTSQFQGPMAVKAEPGLPISPSQAVDVRLLQMLHLNPRPYGPAFM